MSPDPADHGWRIRIAQPSDLPALVAIEKECFPEDAFSIRQIRYYFRRSIPAGNMQILLLCDPAGDTAGAVCLCTPTRPGWRTARLFSIAVRPALQKQNLGDLLLADAEERARQCGYHRIYAETRLDNTASRRLLARRGWRSIRALPDYYGPGADGMKWQLPLCPDVAGGTDSVNRKAPPDPRR